MDYTSTEAKRRELKDTTLAGFMATIEQRLTMGDVTPRGQRVRFDPWAWLRGDTAQLIESGAKAVEAGLMGRDEIRRDWLDRGPLDPDAAPTDSTEGTP
jgi:hypothetical protein